MFNFLKKTSGDKRGFTLIEVLIAMTIFVIFAGVIMTSYTGIARSLKEANEFRQLYSEARTVFEEITSEFREGMVDYGRIEYQNGELRGGRSDIKLVAKDASYKSHLEFAERNGVKKIRICKSELLPTQNPADEVACIKYRDLHSDDVQVSEFKVYVSPVVDPYNQDFVYNDAYQFHPKVTVYAQFVKEMSNGELYEVDLQTSVSSRVYNQIY